MDSKVDNLVISSRNPGYIATLSSVFEVESIEHRLDVEFGLMLIVVPGPWVALARASMCKYGLDECKKLPPVEFNYLNSLDPEELEEVIGQPEVWRQEEIEAARQIKEVKLSTRQKAVDLIHRVPLTFML